MLGYLLRCVRSLLLFLAGGKALLSRTKTRMAAAVARTVSVLAFVLCTLVAADQHQPDFTPAAFYPLPVGHVHARGWLREQLEIQLQGLAGSLHHFYEDVGNSTWLGGNATESGGAPRATMAFSTVPAQMQGVPGEAHAFVSRPSVGVAFGSQ